MKPQSALLSVLCVGALWSPSKPLGILWSPLCGASHSTHISVVKRPNMYIRVCICAPSLYRFHEASSVWGLSRACSVWGLCSHINIHISVFFLLSVSCPWAIFYNTFSWEKMHVRWFYWSINPYIFGITFVYLKDRPICNHALRVSKSCWPYMV